jgi:hypothetical protein
VVFADTFQHRRRQDQHHLAFPEQDELMNLMMRSEKKSKLPLQEPTMPTRFREPQGEKTLYTRVHTLLGFVMTISRDAQRA